MQYFSVMDSHGNAIELSQLSRHSYSMDGRHKIASHLGHCMSEEH